MSTQFENINSIRELLLHFIDEVKFSNFQLSLIIRFLFTQEEKHPDFIDQSTLYTLEYLKDQVFENNLKNISELQEYIQGIIMESEKDLDEFVMCKESDIKENYFKEPYFLDFELANGKLFKSNLSNKEELSYFNILSATENKILESDSSYKFKSENNSEFENELFKKCKIYITNFINKYLSHFYDINKNRCNIFVKESNNLLVDSLDYIINTKCEERHGYFKSILLQNPVFKVVNICDFYNNNNLTQNIRTNDFHYDKLIDRISIESPIQEMEFKINLLKWLMCLKKEKQIISSCGIKYNPLLNQRRNVANSEIFFDKELAYLFSCLKEKNWLILISPNDNGWLTTEDPGFSIDINSFVSLNHDLHPDTNLNNIERDSVVYFPLSKKYCLRIQPTENHDSGEEINNSINFRKSSDIEFEIINRMIVSSNGELIFAADIETLEKFISS